jgi:hypothetical protein
MRRFIHVFVYHGSAPLVCTRTASASLRAGARLSLAPPTLADVLDDIAQVGLEKEGQRAASLC